MKKIFLILFAFVTFVSCKNEAKPTLKISDAKAASPVKDSVLTQDFQIDSLMSTLKWEGYEGLSLGKSEHNGTLNINLGIIKLADGKPMGGKFSVAISSLIVDDIPPTKPGNAKLKKHLLDADFFDVAKFPEATFEITNSVPNGIDSVDITGNLTLKGISKSITFPALIKFTDSNFTASTPKFYINRNDWEMYYRSESSLGNEMIRNEIGIMISLTAKK
jgi:polyisoprenoid-binding protein YceI